MSENFDAGKQAGDYELVRFIQAQESVYARVTDELRRGKKQSHWMWFIFPQIAGLGSSSISRRFALKSLAEAKAYLNHPVLGSRLLECADLLLESTGKSAEEIFGYPDYLKLHSSITLFSVAAPDEPVFGEVLARFFKNSQDKLTIGILKTT